MLSYLSSFLPSSSRKRLRVEVAGDDDDDDEEEGKDAFAKDGRKIAKQLSTKTRNALKQSLEISLARVHEASFYFYAMGANEEGENQLKVLLRNVIEQAENVSILRRNCDGKIKHGAVRFGESDGYHVSSFPRRE